MIIATFFLQIQDVPKIIHYIFAIFDFTMFIQYLLYNNKTPLDIKYALYILNKTKIVFENYHLIDPKLFQLKFNYPKFYVITYFIQCIWNYDSAVNYNMIYSKTAYKYFLKIFY